MADPPSTPSTYDWDRDPTSTAAGGPDPDRTTPEPPPEADRAIPEPPPGTDAWPVSSGARPWTQPAPSRTFPAWAIVAIVALVLLSLLGGLGVVAAALISWNNDDTGVFEVGDGGLDDGIVLDSSGAEVADGTGLYDRPAEVGEHSFVWPSLDGGAITVRATDLDLDATLPRAEGVDVIQPDHRLVVITLQVAYEGEGSILVAEEVWASGETDLAFYPDAGAGLVVNPLADAGVLTDGQATTVTVAIILPEEEKDSLVFMVETPNGIPLYYRGH